MGADAAACPETEPFVRQHRQRRGGVPASCRRADLCLLPGSSCHTDLVRAGPTRAARVCARRNRTDPTEGHQIREVRAGRARAGRAGRARAARARAGGGRGECERPERAGKRRPMPGSRFLLEPPGKAPPRAPGKTSRAGTESKTSAGPTGIDSAHPPKNSTGISEEPGAKKCGQDRRDKCMPTAKNTTFTTLGPNHASDTGKLPRPYPTVISTVARRIPRPAQQTRSHRPNEHAAWLSVVASTALSVHVALIIRSGRRGCAGCWLWFQRPTRVRASTVTGLGVSAHPPAGGMASEPAATSVSLCVCCRFGSRQWRSGGVSCPARTAPGQTPPGPVRRRFAASGVDVDQAIAPRVPVLHLRTCAARLGPQFQHPTSLAQTNGKSEGRVRLATRSAARPSRCRPDRRRRQNRRCPAGPASASGSHPASGRR